MPNVRQSILCLTLLALLITGCSAPAPAPALTASTSLEIILANSRHIVGTDRFVVGVIRDKRSVKDAQLHLAFYDLSTDPPVLRSEADAPFYGDNLGEAGVYVTRATFDKPGKWGVEATVTQPGIPPETQRLGFDVLPQDPSPAIGDDAPHTKTLTLKDVNGDRSKLSTSDEDDSMMHQISMDTALTNGKPTVILFATPKFCTSRTCGPSHQVVLALARNYSDQVNFIHVEPYKDFNTFEPSDAMLDWRLQTEPWLFFVDKNGKIADRFEGGITAKEVNPAFLKFIGQ